MVENTNTGRYEYRGRAITPSGAAGGWVVEENRDGCLWRSRVYSSRHALELAIDNGYPIKTRRGGAEDEDEADAERLYILWANADPATARHMVMMYATNSMLHGWWKEVTVIIWGNTARLAAEDTVIQAAMDAARHAGVEFTACIACAINLGVKDKLELQDVEVVPWGARLTKILKERKTLITI
jgi:hypothetical protein